MDENIIPEQTSPSQNSGADLMSAFEVSQVQGEQESTQEKTPKQTVSAEEWQSRYDKLNNEHAKFKAQFTERDKAYQLLNEAIENPAVARALVAEILPDMVKTEDVDSFVEQQLKKEFGEEFEVDQDDARKGYGKSFRYLERARKLYQEAESKSNKVQTLAEIRAQKQAQKEKEMEEQEVIRQKLITDYKTDDATIGRFFEFFAKATPDNLFKIFQWAESKQRKSGVPTIASQQGAPIAGGSQQMQNFMNSF